MPSADLHAALDETGIDPRTFEEIPVDDCAETVLRSRSEGLEIASTWNALRAALPALGWWPVFYDDYATLASVSRHDMQGPDRLDAAPSAILDRVESFDLDHWLNRERARRRSHMDDEATRRRLAESPTELDIAGAVAALGPRIEQLDLEHWIFEAELAANVPNAEEAVPPDRHNAGFLAEPFLYLLPSPVPWSAGAYLGGYDWGHPHTDLRTALLHRWAMRWGAEMSVNWGGAVFSLEISQPPTSPNDAWQVATEIMIGWPDSAGGRYSSTVVGLARSLQTANRWTLRNEP